MTVICLTSYRLGLLVERPMWDARHQAAVDDELGACRVGGLVAGEEDDHGCHLGWVGASAQRDL